MTWTFVVVKLQNICILIYLYSFVVESIEMVSYTISYHDLLEISKAQNAQILKKMNVLIINKL